MDPLRFTSRMTKYDEPSCQNLADNCSCLHSGVLLHRRKHDDNQQV